MQIDEEGGIDYTLNPGETVWITVGDKSVYLKHGDEGVSIIVYRAGEEDQDSITETWAVFGE